MRIFVFQLIITADVSSLLADVFARQHFAAGFTLEAAQVPLSVQRQKSLAIFNVSTTSCTICEQQESGGLSLGKHFNENQGFPRTTRHLF